MTDFPLPGAATPVVVAPAPGQGPQFWAGAPSAVLDGDGTIVVGYRVRNGPDTTDETVIARSDDGERLETVLVLDQDHFGAQWTERPALVRTDARLAHVRELRDARTPSTGGSRVARGADARRRWPTPRSGPRSRATSGPRVKDPIVRVRDGVWHAWICCHLLDVPGAEDRMNTAYATSADGWTGTGTAPCSRAARRVGRPRRAADDVLPDGRAAYDGRATRGGELVRAHRRSRARTAAATWLDRRRRSPTSATSRSCPCPTARYRIYYEARLPDETPRAAHGADRAVASRDVDLVDARRRGALGEEVRQESECFVGAGRLHLPPDRVPAEGARGQRRAVAERARVPPEGGERHAALVRLVTVLEQEAGHGSQLARQPPARHQGAPLILSARRS